MVIPTPDLVAHVPVLENDGHSSIYSDSFNADSFNNSIRNELDSVASDPQPCLQETILASRAPTLCPGRHDNNIEAGKPNGRRRNYWVH